MMRDYPHIRFERRWDLDREVHYQLGQCRAMISAICEIPLRPEAYRALNLVSLIKGAQATTAIEGNTLTEEEIALVQQGEDLAPSKEYQQGEVRNILAAMNTIIDEVVEGPGQRALIDPALIRRLHLAVGQDLGSHFDAKPGQYRTDDRVVGPYRCPDPRDVEPLVGGLCEWLQVEFGYATGAQRFPEAVVEAIVSHVYLEWIHPFGDGNGRTGRLLEFYVLLRAGVPDIASHILSSFYNRTRPEYYRHLQMSNERRDLSDFVAYAVLGLRDGLRRTLRTVQDSQFETAWFSYIYEQFAERKYRKTVFKRRRGLMLSFPRDVVVRLEDVPLVNPAVAKSYGGLTNRTVRRDLDELAEMQLVRRQDGGYIANTAVLRKHMAKRVPVD